MRNSKKRRITSGLGIALRLEEAKRTLPGDVFLRNIIR